MVRGSQLPEDQAWARSLMQQSWPPSWTGSVLLALEGRVLGPRRLQETAPVREAPGCISALPDPVSRVLVLHQMPLMDPKACGLRGRVTEGAGPGHPGALPGEACFQPMAHEVGCWLRMSGLLLAQLQAFSKGHPEIGRAHV